MATYVYGIVDPSAQPSGKGIAGASLGLVASDRAAALVSDLPDGDLRMGRDEIMTHAHVLEEALGRGTVLPMRFGVVMDDTEEVRRRLLEHHGDSLRTQLDELENKIEMHVRAVYDEKTLLREAVRADPRIARLREVVRRQSEAATYYERIELGERVARAIEEQRERDAGAIIDALAPHALAVEVSAPAHERVAVNASFLVERRLLEKFDAALETIAREYAGRVKFKLTGPRPPHSFVELTGSG